MFVPTTSIFCVFVESIKRNIKFVFLKHVWELNFLMCSSVKNSRCFFEQKNLEAIKPMREISREEWIVKTFTFAIQRFVFNFLSVCFFNNLYLHRRSHDLCLELNVHNEESRQQSIKKCSFTYQSEIKAKEDFLPLLRGLSLSGWFSSKERVIANITSFIETLNVAVVNEACDCRGI